MNYRRFAQFAVAALVTALAIWALVHTARTMSWAHLRAAFAATSWWHMAVAVAATIASFIVLAIYERFATKVVVPGKISLRTALSVGWMAHALSNTLGFHALTGGAVRYKAYRAAGLDAIAIGSIVSLVGISVGLGSGSLLALALIAQPQAPLWQRIAGVALALLLAAAIWWLPAASGKRIFRRVTIPHIRRGWLVQQVGLGLIESLAAAVAFYVLLPPGAAPSFLGLIPVLIVGVFIGILSHSPGGIGVFEATMLAALPDTPPEQVLAALLLYRLIYNVMPSLAAGSIFALRYLVGHAPARKANGKI
jgi:uncharacterized membrane protein YbhN (UPF0104 family)